MIKKIVILISLSALLFSNSFELNENINHFSMVDQFDRVHTINSNIKTILVSFDKERGSDVNRFLASKSSDFLQKHNSVFIANISRMPFIITKMFLLPEMKKSKHTILLIYDKSDKRFLQQEGKTTLYKLEEGVIKSISYIEEKDLPKVFK